MKTLLLLFFHTVQVLSAENNLDSDVISWKEGIQLRLSDFKGLPDKKSHFDAITVTSINYTIYRVDSEVTFETSCSFHKSKSWINKDKYSISLLQHEQGHFDIAAVYSKKLLYELVNAASINGNITDKSALRIYNSILIELIGMHNDYDTETNFSLNKGKQKLWNKKIVSLKKIFIF